MKIIEGLEAEYVEYVEMNSKNPYSKAVVDYTEVWAGLMEKAIEQGQTLSECWKRLSHTADADGITGYMYGCAVEGLARFWTHGDELRRLHNATYGVSEDKAKGGVVNPAILTIET